MPTWQLLLLLLLLLLLFLLMLLLMSLCFYGHDFRSWYIC